MQIQKGLLLIGTIYLTLSLIELSAKSPAANSPPKPAATATQSGDDAAAIQRKREARREQLAKTIARHQSVMDAYDKQNTVRAKGKKSVTDEQYAAAKAARDKAQAERDDLAR